jgi:hypothetical protein
MRFVVEPPTAETLTLEIGELDYMYLAEKGMHPLASILFKQPWLTALTEQSIMIIVITACFPISSPKAILSTSRLASAHAQG